MSNRPKRWPDYALGSCEDALMRLKTIERTACRLQHVGKETDQPDLIILGGDIRSEALSGIHALIQARAGEYS
jgi:hypothetical protein